MVQLGQNSDEVDVAVAADEERDAEKYNAELQTHRQEDVQLGLGEVLVTHFPLFSDSGVGGGGIVGRDGGRRFVIADKGHNEHDAQVDDGENPEEDAGSDCIHRSALQGVLDREGHAEVALHADGGEEEGAVVDGHIEDEPRQRTEGVGHVPNHAVHHLLHLEGQEEEKEEVGDGQVQEQDVDRCRFLPHFPAESVEGQDVGREAQDEGDDVDGQTQAGVALLHGGLCGDQSVRRSRCLT